MSDWTTPAQIATDLKVSTATVYSKIHSGEWEATKISARIYRFSEEQVEAIETGTATAPRKTNKKRLRAALKAIA